MIEIIDIKVPCSPGSLMRSIKISEPGKWRISRRDAELYSVQIVSSGAWGRARVLTGGGRALWFQPSTFTGSFTLLAGNDGDGLIVELASIDAAANLTVNFREPDKRLV